MNHNILSVVTPTKTRPPLLTSSSREGGGNYHFEYTATLLQLDRERQALREKRTSEKCLVYPQHESRKKCRRSLFFPVEGLCKTTNKNGCVIMFQTPTNKETRLVVKIPTLKRKDTSAGLKPDKDLQSPCPVTPTCQEEFEEDGDSSRSGRVHLLSFFEKAA
jgi:hypothetical protein